MARLNSKTGVEEDETI